MFRTVKISPGPQPMIVVSGTLASAPDISFLHVQQQATYNQSRGSRASDQGNDGEKTIYQLQPDQCKEILTPGSFSHILSDQALFFTKSSF